jgi:pyruvate/2-oxoglutarate dehydrogenase complex dihydrolipoamide acyltransferase (E2) component
MPHEIVVPSLGSAMEDVLLVAWLKQPNDPVEAEEPVAEIETDKSVLELVAPVAGRLGSHFYREGATVAVGATIAAVCASDEEALVPDSETSTAGACDAGDEPVTEGPATVATTWPSVNSEPGRLPHRTTPRARTLAKAEGGDFNEATAAKGRFREVTAARVSKSWRTIPHFSVVRDVDIEALHTAVSQLKANGRSVTITDVLLRAHALALTGARIGTTPVTLAFRSRASVV